MLFFQKLVGIDKLHLYVDNAIGHPYGTVFEVRKQQLYLPEKSEEGANGNGTEEQMEEDQSASSTKGRQPISALDLISFFCYCRNCSRASNWAGDFAGRITGNAKIGHEKHRYYCEIESTLYSFSRI